MDIIVTIPNPEKKSVKELCEYYRGLKDRTILYFKVSNLPINAEKGDRCYIVNNGKVIGYHIILSLRYVNKDEAKELSGGWSEGNYILRDSGTFMEVPKIDYKGFRGFRYVKFPT